MSRRGEPGTNCAAGPEQVHDRGGRRSAALAVLVAVAALVAAACSSDEPELADPVAQGDVVFATGELSDVPLPVGSVETSAPSDVDGVVAASYEQSQLPPVEVVSRMETALVDAGWEELTPFTEAGERVFRGAFTMDDRRLDVTVAVAPDAQTGQPVAGVDAEGSEIGLVLRASTGGQQDTVPPLSTPEQGEGAS